MSNAATLFTRRTKSSRLRSTEPTRGKGRLLDELLLARARQELTRPGVTRDLHVIACEKVSRHGGALSIPAVAHRGVSSNSARHNPDDVVPGPADVKQERQPLRRNRPGDRALTRARYPRSIRRHGEEADGVGLGAAGGGMDA